ncbi:MAG: Ig-like domain repeat protein, partial [Terriglobales bacterium]
MRLGSRFLSFLLVLFVLVAVSTTTLFASIHTTASPKVRITSKVDNNKRTTLHRHVPTAVRNGMDMGRVEPTTPVEHLVMVLKSDEDQKREIRRVIDEQQDKHTQNYHQWATPEEFGEHFGVHDSDIENIKAWLSSQGLTVEGVNKSKRVLHFSGTIGQLEGAFHVQMHYFLMPNGETHVSNDRDITVPTALATVIGGVPTLNDFFRKSHMVDVGRYSRFKPGPKYTASTSTHYVSATDFATIYNSAPLLAQGINGTGVTIGIVGRSDILLSDVQAYRQMMGLQANDPNFIHAGQDAGTLPGDDGESDLDVEISGGMAPGATVDFVIGTPTFLVDGITNSFEYLIENNIADIISSSYGDCEGNEGAGGNLFNNQLFEQAAAQGTSVFIAAGDNGPAGCDNQSADLYEVLGYAAPAEGSTWYNIAAGGSEFDEGANVATYWSPTNTGGSGVNSALTYIPEVPWNEAKDCSYDPAGEACGELWSGSGAISAYYLQPPWQRGSGVPTSDPTLTLASGATGLWVTGINITNPGSGYTTAPTMTISGGGCLTEPYTTGAVTISGGSISSIVFPNDGTQGGTLHVGQGFGCTSAPTVAFTAAPAGGVTATATTTVGQMQNILPLVSGVPHRYTPDIALNAASGHDATFYCSEGVCELNSSGAFLDAGLVGGTSVAAPSMAGVQALINQANGGRQGMPGYIYYALSAAQSESACNSSTPPANGNTCAFHDITTGNNFICGESTCTTTTAQIGFPAKSGYDMATGLGSPNVANLASQWGSVVFNSSNATLNLSQTTFQHGASVTLSGTVAAGSGSGTPTGDVAFIVSQGSIGDTNNETTGAQNGPVAFATLSGGSYSATLNNLPGGTYYVTARYAGDENFASSLSAGVPVTVSSEPGAVTLTPYLLNGTSCEISTQNSFSYGQDTLINVNVAGVSGNGAPTGTVALTLDGNPWTTVTLDPNGNAFAYSGATGADTSCVYDYSFPSVNMIPGGSHSIGATYSGDNSVGTATATPASITVAPISPGTLTFAAAGSSTGAGVIAAGATVPLAITFPTVSALTTFEPTPGASGPTGTITFTDTTTSTIIGTATVNPYVVYENEGSSTSAVPEWLYNATAKTTTNGITASGAHSIEASYSGDTNYTSTTATSTVTVGGTTATTVAVTASANPTTLGGTPTLTATITSSPATTAGTVTFFDGTTVLGQGSTVGTAHTSTLKLSSTYPFTGGAHSITASYSGTGTTSQASTSPVFTENVTQGTMTINLTTKTTDVNGNNFSFSAFLQCVSPCSQNRDTGAEMFSNIYGPTLSVVNFYDGATLLGSAPATLITYVQGGYGDWIAQFTTPLSTGAHSITAKYSDTNYASATSNAQAITVTTAQTITWATPPPASALTGSTFTVAATGGASGNAIAYTSAGACTNSGATYTMNTGNGSCTVVATQAGNSSYAAGELSTYVAALKNAQAITFTTPAPASAEYGSSFTVAATGGASGNAVTFASAGACTNSGATYTITAGTGTCSVIANQAGNANYSAAPTVTETTSATDSNGSVSVASGLNPSTYGTSVTFTATITSDTGAVKGRKNGAKPAVVTGTVTWSANTGCSPSSISGGYPGTATCTTSSLATGSDTVTGTYGGDGNHNGGSGSVSQTVDQASTTTAVASSLNPSEYGQAVSFSATVTGASPTGTVQFYINGSLFDTETLASGTATSVSTSALTAGTYTVTATYSGDTNNTGSSGTLAGGQVVNGSNST